MGNKNKQLLKRKAARVWVNLEHAIGHLADLYQVFEPVHPDHAALIKHIAEDIIIAQNKFEQFWEVSWGDLPENWETWAE